MKHFMQIVVRMINKLALWLGYLSLAAALVVAVIVINKYLSGRDSPAKEPETAISRAIAEPWVSEGKVIAGPFDVQIWQYGKVVTPVAGIVTLDRQPFDIKNQHNEDQAIYLTASSSPELKKQFDSGESISDIEIFGPGRGWAEGQNNADRNLTLGDEGYHYLFHKELDGGGRYNGREVIGGLNYFIRRVVSVAGDASFSSDGLYLTLVKSAYVGWKDYPKVVEGRASIEINFRQLNGKVYIHPECLDFLAPWSKGNTESIDCSGLDLSKVKTQGDEFGARYGEGQAIAYKHADVDLKLPLGIALLEVGIDGGGSGLFSSIVLLKKDQTSSNVYEVLIDTPSGDRCNDGNKWVSEASSDGFTFKSAATPFRLLNPDDATDWRNWYLAKALMDEAGEDLDRPSVFNEWEPYEDVTNSANACFGWIVRRFDYETGFEVIGVELETNFEPQAEDGSLEVCVDNWLLSQAGKEGLFVDKDEWDSKLGGLKQVCISDSKS